MLLWMSVSALTSVWESESVSVLASVAALMLVLAWGYVLVPLCASVSPWPVHNLRREQ